MRAQRIAGPAPIGTRPLVLTEVPDPVPGPGEVRIRVHACGCCRTDLHVVEGDLDLPHLPVVNPPDTKRIDVTCDHVTTGLQVVRRLPGVRTATVFGQSMHLLVDEGMSERLILAELAKHKIPRADIRPIAPSLEDVFVALTNNGK